MPVAAGRSGVPVRCWQGAVNDHKENAIKKRQMIGAVAAKTGDSNGATAEAIDALIAAIAEQVAEGKAG